VTTTATAPHACEDGWAETGKGEFYPCRVCRPAQFFRWVGGHYNRDHDRASCPECRTPGSTSSARKRERRPEPEHVPPPSDEDAARAGVDVPHHHQEPLLEDEPEDHRPGWRRDVDG
jgi:hypothetical protein